jgi:dolichol-phosphate mannosyltransferase
MDCDTLVISPVYNERQTLRRFYEQLRESCPWDILFVNDGSSDGSEKILKKINLNSIQRDHITLDPINCNVNIISHHSRIGYGAALSTGFRYAINHEYDKVVTIDSDLQHRPEDISRFVYELDKYDVVLGTRYQNVHNSLSTPITRYIINRYISGLLNRYFQVDFSDPFCGFRGYRTSFLKKVRLHEKSYGVCLEMLVEMIRIEAYFCEIPVDLIYFNRPRTFQDGLNDPAKRIDYYNSILWNRRNELEKDKSSLHFYV